MSPMGADARAAVATPPVGDRAPSRSRLTLLKWPGGKSRELAHLLPLLVDRGGRFLDPFVGGGSALFAAPHGRAAVNDASADLIALYRCVAERDPDMVGALEALAAAWSAIGEAVRRERTTIERAVGRGRLGEGWAPITDLGHTTGDRSPEHLSHVRARWQVAIDDGVPAKLERMLAVEARRGQPLSAADVVGNVEGALKAALYTAVREDLNDRSASGPAGDGRRAAEFWFVRELAYASMFRFNAAGRFNVPYGGMTYNRKDLTGRIAALVDVDGPVQRRLARTEVHGGDFAAFLDAVAPRPDDLVFVDPPYDSDFSSYDARPFGPDDHRRLAERLRDLRCPFVLVIKATPLVEEVYADPRWSTRAVAQRYQWTIKERNDRTATHLVITGAP